MSKADLGLLTPDGEWYTQKDLIDTVTFVFTSEQDGEVGDAGDASFKTIPEAPGVLEMHSASYGEANPIISAR
jgi:hypothetical protein